MGVNEVADLRLDQATPARPVENPVVPDRLDQKVPALLRRQSAGEPVRGLGLSDASDVVLLALDRHQGDVPHRLGTDLPAAVAIESPGHKPLLEHPLDGLEVEFAGQVHDREILVIEPAMRIGAVAVAAHEVPEVREMRAQVPVKVHCQEAREL